ncbi:hypothetical protein BgiMline_010834 [Biomphalaria glabrata]|nr:hypothetical protein BgiMline_027130 [Biomphalaria glabrata]
MGAYESRGTLSSSRGNNGALEYPVSDVSSILNIDDTVPFAFSELGIILKRPRDNTLLARNGLDHLHLSLQEMSDPHLILKKRKIKMPNC